MKLYIKNLILFCSLVSVLTSCDLDVVPPAEISAENFWKTEKDAWYALNGCYQSMPAVDIWDEMCDCNEAWSLKVYKKQSKGKKDFITCSVM